MTSRMKGMVQRERLGAKKIWMYDKLPPLENGIITKNEPPRSLMNSLN